MALPPLELFSLKKRPPCCRVASSRFRVQLSGDCGRKIFPKRKPMKKIHFDLYFDLEDRCHDADARECKEKEALHVSRSASCVADINRSFVSRHIDMAHTSSRRRRSQRKRFLSYSISVMP